jgi:superfamily I DNA and/or RNA helicase
VTDENGTTRRLEAPDIMVVAPYNLAVACIRAQVPDGVEVGTVDRFQGREAPVVFYAMTCSSGEDVPRGLDFLFTRNRMNVAISRAQCLAVMVVSERLLDADCRTLEAMELVDGACRFAEMARPAGPEALAAAA